MSALSERFRRQAEPKLMPSDVVANATNIMNRAEAAFVNNSERIQLLMDGYAERGSSFVFAYEKGDTEIQFHTHIKRRPFSTSRTMSVFVQYPDKQDPSIKHYDQLKLSCRKSKQTPEQIKGKIKTIVRGVSNVNNKTAVQNAEEFINHLAEPSKSR